MRSIFEQMPQTLGEPPGIQLAAAPIQGHGPAASRYGRQESVGFPLQTAVGIAARLDENRTITDLDVDSDPSTILPAELLPASDAAPAGPHDLHQPLHGT
jgi:hypothetical protein